MLKKNRSIPDSVIIPVLAYPSVTEAATWLCNAFGFRERIRIGDHRIQLEFEGAGLVVTADADASAAQSKTASVMIRVSSVDEHHARAKAAGAQIAHEPAEHAYGEKQYSAVDPAGYRWTFSETTADVDPASWGGEVRG